MPFVAERLSVGECSRRGAVTTTAERRPDGSDTTRTPQEVFQHHGETLSAEWELISTNFEDDILLLEWKATSGQDQGRGRDRHVRVPGRDDPRPDRALHAHEQLSVYIER